MCAVRDTHSNVSLFAYQPEYFEVLPGYDITAWISLFAPAGAPNEAIQKVHAANVKALAKPDVVAKLAAVGMTPAPMSPTS